MGKVLLRTRIWLFAKLERSSYWLDLACLVILFALVLPVLAAPFGSVDHDAARYMTWGFNLFSGRGYTNEIGALITIRPPLYPALLALVYHFFGVSVEVTAWVTKIFGICLNLILVYLLGKQIYGRLVGMIAGVLIASTTGLAMLYNEIKLDPVAIVFLHTSLLLILTAFYQKNGRIAVLSGFFLGITFLFKDTAIMWLPVPLYLILFIPSFRTRWHIEKAYLIWLVFIYTVVPWWIAFYLMSGKIYMASQITTSWGWVLPYFFISIPLIVTILWLGRNKVFRLFSFLSRLPSRAFTISGVLLWALFTQAYLILLWWGNIIPLSQFINSGIIHFQKTLIPHLEGFQFIPATWIIIILLSILKKEEDRITLVLGLTCVPIFLFVSDFPDTYIGRFDEIRQLLALVSISYIALARSITIPLKWLSAKIFSFKSISLNNYRVFALSFLLLIAITAIGFSRNELFYSSRIANGNTNYLNELHVRNRFTQATLDVAGTMNAKIPPNSNFLFVSTLYETSYYLLTKGQINFYTLPRVFKYTDLRVLDGKYCLADRLNDISSEKQTCITKQPFYFVRISSGPWKDQYHMNFIEDLKEIVMKNQIDYIYFVSRPAYFDDTLIYDPSIFTSEFGSMAFNLLYSTNLDDMNFYIYHVNRDFIEHIDNIPLTMDYNYTWKGLSADTKNVLGNDDLPALLNALGNRVIRFVEDKTNKNLVRKYLDIANAYQSQGLVDEAVREYRVALSANSSFVNNVYPPALAMLASSPKKGPPMVLLGDLNYLLGNYSDASGWYENAVSQPDLPGDLLGIAYQGLGNTALNNGDFKTALSWFEKARQVMPVKPIEAAIMRTQSMEALQNGEIGLAQFFEQKALEIEKPVLSSAKQNNAANANELLLVDLLGLPRDIISTPQMSFVKDGIFKIGDIVKPVLFAHPTSAVSYSISVPEKAHLRFSIALSPEVWSAEKGDGATFKVLLDDSANTYVLLDTYLDPKNLKEDRHWRDFDIDLSQWNFQNVKIQFITGPGPNGNDNYDWAGWGEPRLVYPAYYSFTSHFDIANLDKSDPNLIHLDWMEINGQLRNIIFQHPTSEISYSPQILPGSKLCFGIGMDPAVWSADKGDGALYEIKIKDNEQEKVIFSQYFDPKNNPEDHIWSDHCVSLNDYSGKNVIVSFVVKPGPQNDERFDWAVWSNPVLLEDPNAENYQPVQK